MQLRRRTKRQRENPEKPVGFTLIEVMFAVFILILMAFMIAAVVPISIRANKTSSNYQTAMQIARRKLDQIQDSKAGFTKLRCTDLAGTGTDKLGILDADGCTETGTFPQSNYRLTGTFTTVDKLSDNDAVTGIFVEGATGTMTIQPWEDSLKLYNGNTEGYLMKATVTISWRIYTNQSTANTPISTYTISTLITRMTMQ